MKALLGSRAFLLVLSAIVMLGGVFLLRAWHENRNDLLREEIARQQETVRRLRHELIAWRVKEAQARSLPAIQAKIEEFHLNLHRPSEQQKDQILIVQEPDWSAMIHPRVPSRALSSSPQPRTTNSVLRSRAAGLWAGDASPVPQPSYTP